MNAEGMVGSLVVAKFADGRINFGGRVVSATNRPTVQIRRPDGTDANWIADMCDVVSADDAVAEAILPLVAQTGEKR